MAFANGVTIMHDVASMTPEILLIKGTRYQLISFLSDVESRSTNSGHSCCTCAISPFVLLLWHSLGVDNISKRTIQLFKERNTCSHCCLLIEPNALENSKGHTVCYVLFEGIEESHLTRRAVTWKMFTSANTRNE